MQLTRLKGLTALKPRIPMDEQLFLEHPSWPISDGDVKAASKALFNVPEIPQYGPYYYFADDPIRFKPSNPPSRGGVLYMVLGNHVVVKLFVDDCLQLALLVPEELSVPDGLGKLLARAFGGRMVQRGANREKDLEQQYLKLGDFERTPEDVSHVLCFSL